MTNIEYNSNKYRINSRSKSNAVNKRKCEIEMYLYEYIAGPDNNGKVKWHRAALCHKVRHSSLAEM